MSNLLDRALPLLPNPQQIELGPRRWQPRANWRFSERGTRWTYGRLATDLQPPAHESPEAYTLVTGPEGAAAAARHPLGLLRARATLRQLLTLAGDGAIPEVRITDWPDTLIRGVHLDLKYIMHRKDYLLRWLDTLADYKVNTLLLEYEDKFPYRSHPVLRHPLAFTEAELKKFLARARGHGIRVVPLIQNMGHVEYILKHECFAHLRRNGWHTEYDTALPAVMPLVREILDDVLRFHAEDEWFHVGGDECFSLHKLPDAEAARLYGDHMAQVLRHVVAAGKRPLMWQDMVTRASGDIRAGLLAKFPKQTILCHWNYNSTPRPTKRGDVAFAPERWLELQQAGFDTIGVSCKNWGTLVPMYSRYVAANTIQVVREAHQFGATGVIQSSWACFNIPLPLEDYGMALGADRAWRIRPETEVRGFDDAWARLHFGLPDARAVEALNLLGGEIELPTELGRPIHLPHWMYMDLVLHYRNAQADRIKYGPAGFPPGIDWTQVMRRRLELYRNSPARHTATAAIGRFARQAQAAAELLPALRRQAKRNREELALLEWAAQYRRHASDRFLLLADGKTSGAMLRASRRLRAQMRKNYGWFLEADEAALQAASLFTGEEQLLLP